MPEPTKDPTKGYKKGQRFSAAHQEMSADLEAFIDEWLGEPKPQGVAHEFPQNGFIHVQLRLTPEQMKRLRAAMRVAEIRTGLEGRPKFRPPAVPADLPDLVDRFNRRATTKNTDGLVTVGELRAGLAACPDDTYVVIPADDDGDTPLAVDHADRIQAIPVWYNPTDCTWSGESHLVDQSYETNEEDRYVPEPGRDVVAIVLEGTR